MSQIKITLIAIFIAFLLSAFSVVFSLQLLAETSPSIISKIILWNMFLAIDLIKTGWLPACQNCEMAILLYIIFYGFLIGLAGYFSAAYSVIMLIDQKERTKRKSVDDRQNITRFPF